MKNIDYNCAYNKFVIQNMPDFSCVGGCIKYAPDTISFEFHLRNDKSPTGLLVVVTIHGEAEASFAVFQVQNDQLFHLHSIEGDKVTTRVSVNSFAEGKSFASTITVTNDATARLSLHFKIETVMDDNSKMVLTANDVEYDLVLCANGVANGVAYDLVQRAMVLILDTDDDKSDRGTDNDSTVSDTDEEVMILN